MQSKHCECGHVVLGDTCSHCARRRQLAIAAKAAKSTAYTGFGNIPVEWRALKSLLDQGSITEAECNERRTAILASF